MKPIILCADDYGQNSAISQAIIELIEKNRLSATSCMTNSPFWPAHAKGLLPFKNQVDIGLHFNLTTGAPLSNAISRFDSLPQLIMKAYLHQLKREAIEIELNAQLDSFLEEIGKLPDFIDGHQHIQQLPSVRDAVLNVYEKRLREAGCYVRQVSNPAAFWQMRASGYAKKIIIQLCGAYTFKRLLVERDIPHNLFFSGGYHFSDAKRYSAIFPQFLQHIREQGIIMCHPGLAVGEEDDPIASARYFEYQYLKSDVFTELCVAQQIHLQRFTIV